MGMIKPSYQRAALLVSLGLVLVLWLSSQPPIPRAPVGTSLPSIRPATWIAFPPARLVRPGQPHGFAALVDAIDTETDPDRRSETLDQAIAALADNDLPSAIAALMDDPRPTAGDIRQLMLKRWAEKEPAKVADWASRLPPGPTYTSALEQLAIAWANIDLPSAERWLGALPGGEAKSNATLALGYEVARTDPVKALALAIDLPANASRDNMLLHAVSQWADVDAPGAIGWVRQWPDSGLRERMLGSAAVAMANQDGQAAAQLAASELGPGGQASAAVAIVQRWGQQAPRDAVAWVRQFPETTVRDSAMESLLGVWQFHDPRDASD
jgi:hypothetical protein